MTHWNTQLLNYHAAFYGRHFVGAKCGVHMVLALIARHILLALIHTSDRNHLHVRHDSLIVRWYGDMPHWNAQLLNNHATFCGSAPFLPLFARHILLPLIYRCRMNQSHMTAMWLIHTEILLIWVLSCLTPTLRIVGAKFGAHVLLALIARHILHPLIYRCHITHLYMRCDSFIRRPDSLEYTAAGQP